MSLSVDVDGEHRLSSIESQNTVPRIGMTALIALPPLSCRQRPPLHAHFRHYSMPTLLRGVACLETDAQ